VSKAPQDAETLQKRVAANLVYYRRSKGMTQSELAERLNYSDKSISKWERGGGMPDIYVLVTLSELYGVSVDTLLAENANLKRDEHLEIRERSRFMLCLQTVCFIWIFATLIFACLKIFFSETKFGVYAWTVFVTAVPVSSIALVILSVRWWGALMRLISVSALAWTSAACVFLFLMNFEFTWLLFVVCGVIQTYIVLWYVRHWLTDRSAKKFSTRMN